jgi:hypothetical protein
MSELERKPALPFNSPLETGIRSVGVLVATYPKAFDLQRLVAFDYLVVHTGDLGGPESLHPELPMRSAELLVRRGLVERGLLLMRSRELIEREANPEGIFQSRRIRRNLHCELGKPLPHRPTRANEMGCRCFRRYGARHVSRDHASGIRAMD